MLKRCSAINCQKTIFANRFLCNGCMALVPAILQKEISNLTYRLKNNVALISKEETLKIKEKLESSQELAITTVLWATTKPQEQTN